MRAFRLGSACAALVLGSALAMPALCNSYPFSSTPSAAPLRPEVAIDVLTSQIQSGKLDSKALAQAHFDRGVAEFRLKKSDAAEADFTSAIQLDDKPVYRLGRVAVLSTGKRYREAIADAEAMERLEPKSALGHATHAALLQMLGDVPGYSAKLKEVAAVAGDPAAVFQYQADRDFSEGRFEFAVADYDLLLALKPNAADKISNRADALLSEGRYADALAGYDMAIRLDPSESIARDAHRNRPQALYGLGHYQEAEAADIEELNRHPDDIYALLRLHVIRLRLGTADIANLDQRAAHVDLTKWPAPILKYFTAEGSEADVYRQAEQGSPEEIAGQRCEAAFYVGVVKLRKGEPNDGRAMLEKAKEICPPGFAEAIGARMELEGQ